MGMHDFRPSLSIVGIVELLSVISNTLIVNMIGSLGMLRKNEDLLLNKIDDQAKHIEFTKLCPQVEWHTI